MDNITFDIRAYPIDDPKGSTLAFASVAFAKDGENLAAIRGIRVVNGEKGLFVTMPQSMDKDGNYRDIAFPLDGDLRKELNAAVFAEYGNQASQQPSQRGYGKPEPGINGGVSAENIKIDVRVFPIERQKSSTLGFASVSFDDIMAIHGIRIVDSGKGMFVSMPQSKDKDGNYRDVAFPLSGGLRKAVNKAVLDGYSQAAAEKKQAIAGRLAAGAEKSAQYAATAPKRDSTAKGNPTGRGD